MTHFARPALARRAVPVFAFIAAFSLSTLAFAASSNFERAVPNDDSSMTLVHPHFTYNGNTLSFAYRDGTDLRMEGTGICALMGYPRFVAGDLVEAGWGLYPSVDTSGQFSGEIQAHLVFDDVTCAGGQRAASTRFDRGVVNDDGSVTMALPQFKYVDDVLPLAYLPYQPSAAQGLGVCHLYGYERFVTAEVMDAPVADGALYPWVGFTGEFSGRVQTTRIYQSVTCTNAAAL